MRVRIYVMLGHKYQNEHRLTLNDIESVGMPYARPKD